MGIVRSAIWSTRRSPARLYAHKLCELKRRYPTNIFTGAEHRVPEYQPVAA